MHSIIHDLNSCIMAYLNKAGAYQKNVQSNIRGACRGYSWQLHRPHPQTILAVCKSSSAISAGLLAAVVGPQPIPTSPPPLTQDSRAPVPAEYAVACASDQRQRQLNRAPREPTPYSVAVPVPTSNSHSRTGSEVGSKKKPPVKPRRLKSLKADTGVTMEEGERGEGVGGKPAASAVVVEMQAKERPRLNTFAVSPRSAVQSAERQARRHTEVRRGLEGGVARNIGSADYLKVVL